MSVAGITTLLAISFLVHPGRETTPAESGQEFETQVAAKLPHQWLTSYQQGAKLAARNQVPLLLHFDATWCGACRRMESEVLNRPEVQSLLGSAVIGVRIDADQHKDLIAEFGISTLPTEVVVMPDGTRGSRFVGAVSLSAYTSRLKNIGSQNKDLIAKGSSPSKAADTDEKNTRSCLIVRHDGKMVGLGGYSPVTLTTSRQWKKGSEDFVAAYEGVDYFFQNAEEVSRFKAQPGLYIPKLHGCDLVALFQENRATAGAIEYGAFYQGQVFFFASIENRDRFETNPDWYAGVRADSLTADDELFPFLNTNIID